MDNTDLQYLSASFEREISRNVKDLSPFCLILGGFCDGFTLHVLVSMKAGVGVFTLSHFPVLWEDRIQFGNFSSPVSS